MNGMWILVAVLVAVAFSRHGRERREGAGKSWWGSLIMLACFAFAFMFLTMGTRGPFRDWHFRLPSLPSMHLSEKPSPPSPAVEAHAPRVDQARQAFAEANHNQHISKSVDASAGHVLSEQTTVITEDGTVIVTSQTPETRTQLTYRRVFADNLGFAVAALIVVAFLYIGYLFLDAGTRGQFTWSLRIFSIVAFAGICVMVALLRQRM